MSRDSAHSVILRVQATKTRRFKGCDTNPMGSGSNEKEHKAWGRPPPPPLRTRDRTCVPHGGLALPSPVVSCVPRPLHRATTAPVPGPRPLPARPVARGIAPACYHPRRRHEGPRAGGSFKGSVAVALVSPYGMEMVSVTKGTHREDGGDTHTLGPINLPERWFLRDKLGTRPGYPAGITGQ